MIAQILYISILIIGVVYLISNSTNNQHIRKYDTASAIFACFTCFFIFWMGSLFETPLNIFGFLLIGFHLYSTSNHVAKSGTEKLVNNTSKSVGFSLGLEITLLYGSGFLDPLFN